jgi:hypothetical protein
MNIQKKPLMRGLVLLAALTVFGLLVGGCESDSVAPQDELPALSKDAAANQAALAATVLASVAPEIVRYDGPTKEAYSYNFLGVEGVTGTVNLEYWTGGIDGTPATFEVGDHARLWTPGLMGVVLETETGGSVSVTFDIHAQVVQATETATIMVGSDGTFTSGDYVTNFNLVNLVVTDSDYPTSGSMEVSAGGFDMIVAFDGDHTALLSIDGEGTWIVDLDDGTRTAIPTM